MRSSLGDGRLIGMEVQFTPEQETRLTLLAAREGIDAEHLVRTAALQLLSGRKDSAQPTSVVEEMRALRARVKPDPDGWTTRDYVVHGRR